MNFGSKIAILSSGASLPEHWQDDYFERYESVIAVNFAGFLFRHHWFSFWENWLLDAELVSPSLNRTVLRIEPLEGYIVPRPFETEKACWVMPMLVGASSFTATEVIRFVVKRASADACIDIFGMDLQGSVDCLGRTGANRTVERWQQERDFVRPLIADPRVTVFGLWQG